MIAMNRIKTVIDCIIS